MKYLILIFSIVAVCYGQADVGSCFGACGLSDPDSDCKCNYNCVTFGDCCPDYQDECFSCNDRCGEDHLFTKPCQCNFDCDKFGDCCPDWKDWCNGTTPIDSCEGVVCDTYDPTKPCQCNAQCVAIGDCCSDYVDECVATCGGRCGTPDDPTRPCQCNSDCQVTETCCEDYIPTCIATTLATKH